MRTGARQQQDTDLTGLEFNVISLEYARGAIVFRGLSLQIAAGEIFGLHGPNGSGKTSLFRVGAGLLQPDEGSVKVAGFEIHEAPPEVRRRCAFVPDDSLLYPDASALENMNLFALLWEVPARLARERTEMLLRDAGLWDVRRQWIRGYSRGMQQRVSVCAALITDPKYFLLDEPFSALDESGITWLNRRLRSVADAGGSVLVTNHSTYGLVDIADRMGTLSDGKIEIERLLPASRPGAQGERS